MLFHIVLANSGNKCLLISVRQLLYLFSKIALKLGSVKIVNVGLAKYLFKMSGISDKDPLVTDRNISINWRICMWGIFAQMNVLQIIEMQFISLWCYSHTWTVLFVVAVATATATATKDHIWSPGVGVASINRYLLVFYKLFLWAGFKIKIT